MARDATALAAPLLPPARRRPRRKSARSPQQQSFQLLRGQTYSPGETAQNRTARCSTGERCRVPAPALCRSTAPATRCTHDSQDRRLQYAGATRTELLSVRTQQERATCTREEIAS